MGKPKNLFDITVTDEQYAVIDGSIVQRYSDTRWLLYDMDLNPQEFVSEKSRNPRLKKIYRTLMAMLEEDEKRKRELNGYRQSPEYAIFRLVRENRKLKRRIARLEKKAAR